MVSCNDCPLKYVGQTGRLLSTRLRENRDSVRLGRSYSALYKHVESTGHTIDFNHADFVYKSSNVCNRLVVESALIKSIPNFNNTEGAVSVDRCSTKLILNSNRAIKSRLGYFNQFFNPD